MFIHDATRRASQSRTLVISYSIPAIINLVEEYRSRVNSARAVRRRAIIVAILLRDTVKRPSSVSFARNSSTNFLRTHPSAFLISPPPPFFHMYNSFIFTSCICIDQWINRPHRSYCGINSQNRKCIAKCFLERFTAPMFNVCLL